MTESNRDQISADIQVVVNDLGRTIASQAVEIAQLRAMLASAEVILAKWDRASEPADEVQTPT